MRDYNFYVYIVTNLSKTTIYVGVTNNMPVRLEQHRENNPAQTHLPESIIAII